MARIGRSFPTHPILGQRYVLAVPITLLPTAMAMPLVVPAPTVAVSSVSVTPSPTAMPLLTAAPALKRTVLPAFITMTLLTTTPALKRTVRPTPVTMPLLTAAFIVRWAVTPAATTITLVTVTPALKRTVRPSAIAMPLVTVNPSVFNEGLVTPGAVAIIFALPAPVTGITAVLVTPVGIAFFTPGVGLIFPARFVQNAVGTRTFNPQPAYARPIYP